ncbi:MAG: DNA mismatch repair protein MutT, partial [Lachnospiraceae bacterium]|nr:DNA mismatch repair protein MutT [Lachnospiraceae bacterium]
MYLYTSDSFEGEQKECDEGELVWIERELVTGLPIWEGDRVFLDLIAKDSPFFSLKLVYDEDGKLKETSLHV